MGKTQKRYGFTLVELLVVLLILGVLVGLAVPRYMDAQKNARFRTFTANVREIQSTLEVYRMDKTSTGPAEYPDNLGELTSYFTQPPINPYTGKSMLTDNSEESGLRYENHGNDYTLCVTQLDVDDIDKDGNSNELIPIISHIAKNDTEETCGITGTPTVAGDTEPPVILTGTIDWYYGAQNFTNGSTVTFSIYTFWNIDRGITLTVSATDNVGVSTVNIVDEDEGWNCDLTPGATPGTWQYTTESFSSGVHRMHIRAFDAVGNSSELTFVVIKHIIVVT